MTGSWTDAKIQATTTAPTVKLFSPYAVEAVHMGLQMLHSVASRCDQEIELATQR